MTIMTCDCVVSLLDLFIARFTCFCFGDFGHQRFDDVPDDGK